MSTITGGSRFSYPFITIGTQIWSTKNLDVSTYRNGDPIPQVTDPIQWLNLTTGAWCYYNNDPANGAIYGKLYNGYAVTDSRGLAPQGGWHIPTLTEWNTLSTYLGGDAIAGGKMKETGTTHWNSPNTGATNSSGFTGLPGGINLNTEGGEFDEINIGGYWWTSDRNNFITLQYDDSYRGSNNGFGSNFGLSVRLIKN